VGFVSADCGLVDGVRVSDVCLVCVCLDIVYLCEVWIGGIYLGRYLEAYLEAGLKQ
jgi:hypothetical protein